MKRGFLNDNANVNVNVNVNPKSKDRQGLLLLRDDSKASKPNLFRSEDRVGVGTGTTAGGLVTKFNRGPSKWGVATTNNSTSTTGTTRTAGSTAASSASQQPPQGVLQQQQQQQQQQPCWTNSRTAAAHGTGMNDEQSHVETVPPSLTGTDISCMTFSQPSVGSHFSSDNTGTDMTTMMTMMRDSQQNDTMLNMNINSRSNNMNNNNNNNPFAGEPLLPCKTTGVPKAALAGWYGQKPRSHQLSKNQ